MTTQNRNNVQIGGSEKMCVLVHRDTKRILCFARDDQFASSFQNAGYEKIAINHANEFDLWSRKLREQASRQNEIEDHAYLERENAVRQRLRQELKDKLRLATSGSEKLWIQSALNTLDKLEARKKRYRKESFQLSEAYEDKQIDGVDLVTKIIGNKQ